MQTLSLIPAVRSARSAAALREVATTAGLAEVVEGLSFKDGKEAVLREIAARGLIEAAAAEPEVEAEAAAPEVTAEPGALTLEQIEAALARLAAIPEDDLTEADNLAEIRLEAMRRKLKGDAEQDSETRANAKRGVPDSSLISEGVRRSWEDGEVRAKRLTRNAVEVSYGKVKDLAYPSLRKAFAALGLPDEKHIRFRVKLKQVGALTFEHNGVAYAFRVLGD